MSASGSLPEGAETGIARTQDTLHRARHLPGYAYTWPDIYQLAIEKIFMTDWFAPRVNRWPKARAV